ncbi:MAG: polysaccharide deacetylase family protein [Pseudomonadota bacterium]
MSGSGADPWVGLSAELDLWHRAGRTATLWWRDDDAIAPSPALDRLLDIAHRNQVPVALAVVPKTATQALADRLANVETVDVLQHGWQHVNHADPGEKKMELGDHRSIEVVLSELTEGFGRLSGLFGPQFQPVLVPPWNRIGKAGGPSLADVGFRGISLFGPRADRRLNDLALTNTHVDPIAWRSHRGFAGIGTTMAALTTHLADRRTGRVDADEPTGLLTHHLDHDKETWDFVEKCVAILAEHQAARLVAAKDTFASGAS